MFVSGDTTPWIIEILQNALNTWNERLGQVFTILTTTPQSFGGGVIYDVIKNINGAMQSIGLSLLVIFLLIGVVKKSTSFEDMKRPEQIIKLFLRFVIGKVVISYGMLLMSEILSVGLGIIANMGTTQIASISIAPEIVAAAQDAGFMATLFPSVLALIGSLIMTVISVMILLTVFGRMFKIYMYMAIAPIPLSTFAGESTKNVGASFLKSFAGVCLEGALIMLACVIYTAYIGSTGSLVLLPADASLTDMLYSYVFGTVLNMLILLGTIKACDRIVREMLFS
ncbi:MAG TPA: hypothetical protein PKB13_06735 [Clostridia bacterium]|nr:hypothetical protein [Clostridia bacterium]